MTKREEEMGAAVEEAERDDAAEDERPYVRARASRTGSQVYSVRIPVEHIEALRRFAKERGLQPTTLMRKWVVERLEREQVHVVGSDPVVIVAPGGPAQLRAKIFGIERKISDSLVAYEMARREKD
jgi:hypothetical protein